MRLLAAATTFAALAAATPVVSAHAQQPEIRAQAVEGAVLAVQVESNVAAKPDMATIQVGVVADGSTAQAALAENARRMNAVMAALKRAGVAERDLQTSQLSVNPQYVYEDGKAPRLTGYQATNMVAAKVRGVDNVGKVVDAAVGDGGNQLQGVSFGVADPDPLLDRARRDAVAKARARAGLYAEAAGLKVARILQIVEGGGAAPPMPMPMMAVRMKAESTPVAAGEVEMAAQVTVVFELR